MGIGNIEKRGKSHYRGYVDGTQRAREQINHKSSQRDSQPRHSTKIRHVF